MTTRALAILNILGCLALVGLITFQWRREQSMERSLRKVTGERDSAVTKVYELEDHRKRLERDVALLKESLKETQQAAEETARQLTEKTELAEKLETDLESAMEQIAAWEAAVAERDKRIAALNGQLAMTRTRLDEAITKLNEIAVERKQ